MGGKGEWRNRDRSLAGMAEELASIRRDRRRVLSLADSKTDIAAVRRAGRKGKDLDTCRK